MCISLMNLVVVLQKKKLRNHYDGPFVVLLSNHMVQLRDLSNDRVLPQSIHLDRLKIAYVRHSTPTNYHQVLTKILAKTFSSQSTQTDEHDIIQPVPYDGKQTDMYEQVQTDRDNNQSPLESASSHDSSSENQHQQVTHRSRRTVHKLLRSRDYDHVDPFSICNHENEQTVSGLQYLVQVAGEPAQNAIWILASSLNMKAKDKIIKRPPPFV